jgi:putative Holliday junction resolvase
VPRGYHPRVRTLALDYGERRIGVAISDPSGVIATPLETITTPRGDADALARIAELVKTREVGQIVLGLPLHMSGRAGPQAEAARAFAATLAEKAGIPVDTLDERWTSVAAERSLRETGRRTIERHGKGVVDEVAATLLLGAYLERMRNAAKP